jgi:L-2,4-diaminobutyric acid acetyltransferase
VRDMLAGGPVLVFRHPELNDARELARLVAGCPPLDVNSEYAYLLLCTHFSKTCMLALEGSRIVGCVTGYVRPDLPQRLFVWQVAVEEGYRQHGVAGKMLNALLTTLSGRDLRVLETTISPSNLPSRRLFSRLARELGAEVSESMLFPSDVFGEQHEAEALITIAPLPASR